MPKPTRRERRKLAEQGKLAPRPMPTSLPERVASLEPRARTRASTPRPITVAPSEPVMLSDASEYAYVKSDLVRIMLLAGTLVGVMVVLKFILPQ